MHDVRTALMSSLAAILILCGASIALSHFDQSAEGLLRVAFFDVGQGDAIFIESPTDTRVLIDGGKDAMVLGELQKTLGFFDHRVDMVIATHPDADHIGGLIEVLHAYDVETIVLTENLNNTPVRDAFMRAVEDEGAMVRYAREGQTYLLGVGETGTTTLQIFFPDIDPTYLESNTSSIIAKLTYGTIDYLLMGDAPRQIEEHLVEKGMEVASEVLKVGHHGSKTSTAETFVSAVRPTYAIISAGKDNSYGHPHADVVARLESYGAVQKNTADEGSIFSYTDGVNIWFK